MSEFNRRRHFLGYTFGLICVMVLLLNGCSRWFGASSADTKPTLPHQMFGVTDSARVNLEKKLMKQHVILITMGEDYLLSIPAYLLFYEASPRLKWSAYPVLNDIACYLGFYRHVSIDVTAYTAHFMSPAREQALSLARANTVANYLWSQAISARFIAAHGLGADKPIVNRPGVGDNSLNARVEITFRPVLV